jgi:hypothetical protein
MELKASKQSTIWDQYDEKHWGHVPFQLRYFP